MGNYVHLFVGKLHCWLKRPEKAGNGPWKTYILFATEVNVANTHKSVGNYFCFGRFESGNASARQHHSFARARVQRVIRIQQRAESFWRCHFKWGINSSSSSINISFEHLTIATKRERMEETFFGVKLDRLGQQITNFFHQQTSHSNFDCLTLWTKPTEA